MQTETFTDTPTSDVIPNVWVRFHKDTGKILQVSVTEPRVRENQSVVQIQDQICYGILTKKIKMRDCHMFYDVVHDSWTAAENSDQINIDHISGKLYKISGKDPTKSEINLRIYPKDSKMDISINIDVLKANFRVSSVASIVNSNKQLFNLYFCKNGDPDYLLGHVEFDPSELLKYQTIRFDLGFLKRYADWDAISIFTRPIFNSYSIEQSYLDVETSLEIDNRVLQSAITGKSAHLDLKFSKNRVVVISNLDESQEYVLSQNKFLEFVVCDNDIDHIIGSFQIEPKQLLQKKSLPILLDFQWPEKPLVLYKNKMLSVKLLGEKNVG